MVVLRIVLGTGDRANEVEFPALALSFLELLLDYGSKRACHIRMTAVAKHAVKENDPRGLHGSVLSDVIDTNLGIDHGVRLALRIDVITKINHVIALGVKDIAILLDNTAQVECLRNKHSGFVCQGSARVETNDRLVLGKRLVARKVQRLEVILLHGITVRKVNGNARSLLEGMGEIDLAKVMLGLLT